MRNNVSFDDLEFEEEGSGHLRASITFPNGYGASVITGPLTYGNDARPFELGVLKNGKLCYTTPVTDDVIGWLTPDMVTDLLNQIADLKAG
jgi:hypothetical protein